MPPRGKLWKDRLRGHKNGVFYLRMLQDGVKSGFLLSVSFDASLRVWDLAQRMVRLKIELKRLLVQRTLT